MIQSLRFEKDNILKVTDLPEPINPNRSGYPWDVGSTRSLPILDLPSITVVTPSYKQGQFIEETIRSVLLQNYPNLQYIIMDGGSTDNTVEVIDHYADFIDTWRSEPDDGQADAINKGFALSSGDIMGWLNSDDILEPNGLIRIGTHFTQHPDSHIVTGFRRVYNQQSVWQRNAFLGYPNTILMRFTNVVFQEATYWRRNLWDNVGELNTAMQFALDYDYWHRILDAGYNFDFIPEYLGGFRVHETSKSSSWEDVHDREVSAIFSKRNIGETVAEASEKYVDNYDELRHEKLTLFKAAGQLKITNSPRIMLKMIQLIDNHPKFFAELIYTWRRWKYGQNAHVKY